MVSDPTKDDRQLALTIYRLVHGCSFKVLKDFFRVTQSVASETFNQLIRVMVSCLYNELVYLSLSDENCRTECKSFIENYESSCASAWDAFRVHLATNLKNNYNFKNKYLISRTGLSGHNKRFLHLTTGTSGSTHDARLLRHTTLFRQIENDAAILNKSIDLGTVIKNGKIPWKHGPYC